MVAAPAFPNLSSTFLSCCDGAGRADAVQLCGRLLVRLEGGGSTMPYPAPWTI
jgi:hypothetical protein